MDHNTNNEEELRRWVGLGHRWAGLRCKSAHVFFLFFFGVDQENIEWGSLQTLGISMSIANSSRDDNLSERVKNSRKKKKIGTLLQIELLEPLGRGAVGKLYIATIYINLLVALASRTQPIPTVITLSLGLSPPLLNMINVLHPNLACILALYPGLPSQLFLQLWKKSPCFLPQLRKKRKGRPGYEAACICTFPCMVGGNSVYMCLGERDTYTTCTRQQIFP